MFKQLKEQFNLIFRHIVPDDLKKLEPIEKFKIYSNAIINMSLIFYPFFVGSLMYWFFTIDGPLFSVSTNSFIVKQVFWFFSIVILFSTKYLPSNLDVYKARMFVLSWILVVITIIVDMSIPYGQYTYNEAADENTTENYISNTTIMKLANSMGITIMYFTSFARGIYSTSESYPKRLVKMNFEKVQEIPGVDILKGLGVLYTGGVVLIFQGLSIVEPLAPMYLVLFYLSGLLYLCDSHYSVLGVYLLRGIVFSVAMVKLALEHQHNTLNFLYNTFTEQLLGYIINAVTVSVNLVFEIHQFWLITELFFMTIYILNRSYIQTELKRFLFLENTKNRMILLGCSISFPIIFILLNIYAEEIINDYPRQKIEIAIAVFLLLEILLVFINLFIPKNTEVNKYFKYSQYLNWLVIFVLSLVAPDMTNSDSHDGLHFLIYLVWILTIIILIRLVYYLCFEWRNNRSVETREPPTGNQNYVQLSIARSESSM